MSDSAVADHVEQRALLDASPDAMVMVDDSGRVVVANTAAASLFRAAGADALRGRRLDDLAVFAPSPDHPLSRSSADDGSPWNFQLKIEGDERLVECRQTRNALPGLHALVLRDVTERAAEEALLLHQAFHDPLTGLANRELFNDRLTQAVARADRHQTRIAVMFVDLDRFKAVNDQHGHAVGDRLLVAVADRLVGTLRAEDTLARVGGDEFTILLEEIRDPAGAVTTAERLLAALQRPFEVDGHTLSVGASIGLALRASQGADPADLLRQADHALYRAKADGRSRHVVFHPRLDSAPRLGREFERALRNAVAKNELCLYYQPETDLATGRIEGFEALVRWRHPRLGLLAPADFIPLAEETGLIGPIGRWVLEAACRQARAWQDHRPDARPIVIGVNVGVAELRQPDYVSVVAEILDRTGLMPQRLELEITERAVIEDFALADATLKELRQLGVRLALDDFGTGYSSLSYLHRLPVDVLKIDRSFIARLDEDEARRSIVQAVVDLGHRLGMLVTAEGVERAVEVAMVRSLGCDRAQGFYFSRPLPSNVVDIFRQRYRRG